ncbi:ATP-binding cassette domain-containing protein [Hydrogenophaga sp.]|uniref:ATP-binding cassette domain-containing protein n=1 Tax=Hydrogenophaga sp. TaxID=1904254 RepID=UPI0019B02BCB|nr:ATP-binding cassette domain-containing protein [Hydrogenophaga sp.]MBD3893505.1 ATP-binding cassette domain-containing protein [Hydrogenophaga sp.]
MSGRPAHQVAPACFELHDVQVRLGPANQLLALNGLNLRIEAGERVALVGANGSGKSTLLRTLHGLQRISAGQLHARPGQRVAMLFQRPHLLRLSALRNVMLGLWLQGLPWSQARLQAQQALQRVDLAALAARNARALSGGQQQRLALARAWATQPEVWLLDEPTASLDPQSRREVETLIAGFSTAPPRSDGTPSWPATLVFSSHNLAQVRRLASRVIYLEQGQLLADLPAHDFFNHQLLQALCPPAYWFTQGESA